MPTDFLDNTMSQKDVRESPTCNSSHEHPSSFIPPSARAAYDKNVTLEEYIYYAKQTRKEEQVALPNPDKSNGMIDQLLRRPSVEQSHSAGSPSDGVESPSGIHEKVNSEASTGLGRAVISNDEWRDASRLMRTASC